MKARTLNTLVATYGLLYVLYRIAEDHPELAASLLAVAKQRSTAQEADQRNDDLLGRVHVVGADGHGGKAAEGHDDKRQQPGGCAEAESGLFINARDDRGNMFVDVRGKGFHQLVPVNRGFFSRFAWALRYVVGLGHGCASVKKTNRKGHAA